VKVSYTFQIAQYGGAFAAPLLTGMQPPRPCAFYRAGEFS